MLGSWCESTVIMSSDFDMAWCELNDRLRDIERRSGLVEAVVALQSHQVASGFIPGMPADIERRTFLHPDDPMLSLRVQYNPKRALRLADRRRISRAAPALGKSACPLCRDNIQRQQKGAQMGYELSARDRDYCALMNPFPLLPGHVVVATLDHHPQAPLFEDRDGVKVSVLLGDLIDLANRMPGYVGFYNGIDAGASIPGHMHFQFFRRPADEQTFPLELAAHRTQRTNGATVLVDRYPLAVAHWHERPETLSSASLEWLTDWGARNRARLDDLTCNLIASRCEGEDRISLYFVPRERKKRYAAGISGFIGGLEVLGEIVLSSQEEKARLDQGGIDYFALERVLASIRTPLYVDQQGN